MTQDQWEASFIEAVSIAYKATDALARVQAQVEKLRHVLDCIRTLSKDEYAKNEAEAGLLVTEEGEGE
jgi:hypothetical protein